MHAEENIGGNAERSKGHNKKTPVGGDHGAGTQSQNSGGSLRHSRNPVSRSAQNTVQKEKRKHGSAL